MKCDSYIPVAPPADLLNAYKAGLIGEKEYIEIYEKHLGTLNVQTVIKHLRQLANNKDIVLLCYETPDDFCHRHLFFKWLQKIVDNAIEFCGEYGKV